MKNEEKSIVTVEDCGARSIDVGAFLQTKKGQACLASIAELSKHIPQHAVRDMYPTKHSEQVIREMFVIRCTNKDGSVEWNEHVPFSSLQSAANTSRELQHLHNSVGKDTTIEIVPVKIVVDNTKRICTIDDNCNLTC